MTIVKWLNDNGVLITAKLADAMAAFESRYGADINDESVSDFIQEVVKFTQEVLNNFDHFKGENDKVEVIHELILALDPHSPLCNAIYQMLFRVTGKVVDFQLGDETDNLIKGIIECTVQCYAATAIDVEVEQ